MYSISPPDSEAGQVEAVLVLQEEDRMEAPSADILISQALGQARKIRAVYYDGDDDEMFCYALEDYPETVIRSSEQSFRADLERWFAFQDMEVLEGAIDGPPLDFEN